MIFKKFNYITPPVNAGQILFRVLSTLIVKYIAKTNLTPNHVTLFRMAVVLASLYFFLKGDYASLRYGVALFYIFEVLDHVDGDLARYTKQFSRIGPLLEQFIDTWSSRPSNLFGFCIAFGMYCQTNSFAGFILFGLTAFGRIMWLEYRDYFGWDRSIQESTYNYHSIYDSTSFFETFKNLFKILYVWNNTFLLLGCLFAQPFKLFWGVDILLIAFTIVCFLNNLPWVAILYKGFSKALKEQ